MIEKKVKISLDEGLDARPIAVLVQKASMFESSVYIITEGKKVNAKSIMGMMSLGLDIGKEVTLAVEGRDEQQAAESIEEYLSKKA